MAAAQKREKPQGTVLVKGDERRTLYSPEDVVKAKFDGFAVEAPKGKASSAGAPATPTK